MDAATRRNVGIILAVVGLLLLVVVLGVTAVDTFLWTDPDEGYDYAVLGGGCCCSLIAGLIFLYGAVSAGAAARAA